MRGDPIRIDDPAEMDALLPIVCRLLEFLGKPGAALHVRMLRALGGAARVMTIPRRELPERLDILALARLVQEEIQKGPTHVEIRR